MFLTSLLIRGIHVGEISKLGWMIGVAEHVISTPVVTFNLKNPSFIPDYPMTFFIGMLGHFRL
jgi:hypothetical protein